jgi:hypothetical protein
MADKLREFMVEHQLLGHRCIYSGLPAKEMCCKMPTLFCCRLNKGLLPPPLAGMGENLPELEFLKSLWGLGTEEEEGYRTGPPGYIGWRNSFLGIDSGAPYAFKNMGSDTKAEE